MTAEPAGAVRLDLEPMLLAMARQQAGVMGLDLDRCEPDAVERLKQQLVGALVAGLPVLLEQLQAQGWRAPEAAAEPAPEPALPRWPYDH